MVLAAPHAAFRGVPLHAACPRRAPRRAAAPARARFAPRRAASDAPPPPPVTELLADAVRGRNEVLSASLDPDVRRRAEEAIARRGGRVTLGDVAGDAGLSLGAAEAALRALAADAAASLQVSPDGEIVYAFERNFAAGIRARSLRLRAEPALEKAAEVAGYVGRLAFGTALISSVLVAFSALAVISASGRDDRRGGRGGGGGMVFGGGPRLWFSPTDILWYWDPWAWRRRQAFRAAAVAAGGDGSEAGIGFLEAIFSFVFGDGDPNGAYERARWEALGRAVAARGGVVAAEELAPFLDLAPEQAARLRRGGGAVVDESWVLPALARLGGSPEVDAAGRILYRFPALQRTGSAAAAAYPTAPAALEARWEMTAASPAQRFGVVALGVANLVGVAALASALAVPANYYALARGGLGWVPATLPLLQAYAATFFAIPAVRWLFNGRRNAAIDARNAARREALAALARPNAELAAKLQRAEALAERRVVSERDAVYRSDRPLEAQPVDLEADAWERRLERRASERRN
jgi:hypothetical protein